MAQSRITYYDGVQQLVAFFRNGPGHPGNKQVLAHAAFSLGVTVEGLKGALEAKGCTPQMHRASLNVIELWKQRSEVASLTRALERMRTVIDKALPREDDEEE